MGGADNALASDRAGQLLHADPAQWAVAPGWAPVVGSFFESAAGQKLTGFLQSRLAAGAVVFPPEPLRALELTAPEDVRVVILGQDPYHGRGQAEGLAFSVAPGVALPPSLRNIFKELQRDLGQALPTEGCLEPWATRGVLLLNTCLTVEAGQAASHAGWGWEVLTDALVEAVASSAPACVYLLWGAHAQSKASKIEVCARSHGHEALLLSSNHPSPLSASRGPQPFLGNGHFSQARNWLAARGYPLHWAL